MHREEEEEEEDDDEVEEGEEEETISGSDSNALDCPAAAAATALAEATKAGEPAAAEAARVVEVNRKAAEEPYNMFGKLVEAAKNLVAASDGSSGGGRTGVYRGIMINEVVLGNTVFYTTPFLQG